jgi:hypothetical protein
MAYKATVMPGTDQSGCMRQKMMISAAYERLLSPDLGMRGKLLTSDYYVTTTVKCLVACCSTQHVSKCEFGPNLITVANVEFVNTSQDGAFNSSRIFNSEL